MLPKQIILFYLNCTVLVLRMETFTSRTFFPYRQPFKFQFLLPTLGTCRLQY